MEHLFLECTIRAALLVASTAIVLHVMRIKRAASKHRVWSAVVFLMLVLPVWTAWGPKAAFPVLPPLTQATAHHTIAPVVSLSIAFLSARPDFALSAFLLSAYLLGLGFLLFRLVIGTIRAYRITRDSELNEGVRSSHLCAAPITVGFVRPTVVLPNHWHRWSQAQLDAVLTHECEHARRRDSLVKWLALLNRAFFWFHPVAWWLERHLCALAEEACDDAVLARGHEPREYCESLIEMARSVTRAGARVNIAGLSMPGGFLSQRIRKIIEHAPLPRIPRTQMTCVAVIWTIMCLVTVGGTLGRIRHASFEQSTKTDHHPDAVQIITPHEGVDFTGFSADLVRVVRRNWYAKLPSEAMQGMKGRVVISFGIQRDGQLSDVPKVEVSSGNKALDEAAVSAVRASAPFEHLPKAFKGPNIELRLTFFYNRPIIGPPPKS